MNKSESIKELATALSKAQGEIVDAGKANQAYNYKYADLSQILQIVRPIFSKHGLSVTQMPLDYESANRIGVETMLMHSSGEWINSSFSMPMQQSKQMTQAQCAGSILTYARRYALAAVAGITQEDNDAALQKQAVKQQEQQTQTAKQLHDLALNDHLESVDVIKQAIKEDDLSTGAEAWFELDEETQRALWLAPSKGGIFSTHERKVMKEDFRKALNGE